MKYGIIDLGSNTIRLVIYKVDMVGLKRIFNIKNMTKSISYVNGGELTPAGVTAIAVALKELSAVAGAFKVDRLHCFATASLRNITNTDKAISEINTITGITPEVLTGEEEAYFDFIGAKYGLKLPAEGVAIDIGGGSTEIIHFISSECNNRISLPFGSLSLYLSFIKDVFPSEKEHEKIRKYIKENLEKVKWLNELKVPNIIGIGGSARAMVSIHTQLEGYDGELHGYTIDTKHLKRLSYIADDKKAAGVKLLTRLLPERFTTVTPGMIVFNEIAKKLNAKSFTLCKYGVREGYLLERVINKKAEV